MTSRLKILNGEHKGSTFTLHEGNNNLGRRSDNDIVVPDPTISRYHATIEQRENICTLKKLSDNSLLKVDGHDVESFQLGQQHHVQMGKVLFQYRVFSNIGEKLIPAPIPNTAITQQNDALEMSTITGDLSMIEEESEVIERDAPKKFSITTVIQLLALLVLGVMAFIVLGSIKSEELEPIILPYRAGEEKLIDLDGHLRQHKVNERPQSIELDNPMVLRVSLDPPPLAILWFKSLEQGECMVTLFGSGHQPLLKFKFIIKDAVDSRSDAFKRENLSIEAQLERAKTLMAKGEIISRENPYEAYEYYEKAMQYLEAVSTSSPLYFECRELMAEPKKALDERLAFLWKEANNYRKNKAYENALRYIEEILALVKDPANIDHQRAQIHKKHILRKIVK